MTQGYGPQDPNQPGYGGQPGYAQQQPPPQPSGAGPPAGYAQPYSGEMAGRFMGRELANWPQRAIGYAIDILIVLTPIFLAGILLRPAPGETTSGTSALVVSLLYLTSFAIWVYNRWVLQGRTGQSWGKQVMNTRLLRMQDGQPVGGAIALVRDLAHILDGLPCFLLPIGFLWPIWDARRQTFADKIVNTVVVAER